MLDEAKLRRVLAAALEVPEEAIDEESSPDTIESWDSLAHLNLILALEEEFDVVIPDEDAADLTSYKLLRLAIGEAQDGA